MSHPQPQPCLALGFGAKVTHWGPTFQNLWRWTRYEHGEPTHACNCPVPMPWKEAERLRAIDEDLELA